MLTKCPECQKEVSDKAQSCPNCGFPISNYFNDKAGRSEPRCITCGSTKVVKLRPPRLMPLYTDPKQFSCRSCGYEW